MDNMIILYVNGLELHIEPEFEWDDIEDRYYIEDVRAVEGVDAEGNFVYTTVDEAITYLLNNELHNIFLEQLDGQTGNPDAA